MPRVVTCPTPILVETKGTASTMTSLYPCFQINVSSYTNTDREQEETKNISMFEAYHSFQTLKVSLRWAHQFWYLYPLVNNLTYDLKLPTPLQTCTCACAHTPTSSTSFSSLAFCSCSSASRMPFLTTSVMFCSN